jgi:transcriptional regulator with XRE-family HTH domain
MSYFNAARLRQLRMEKRMSLTDVSGMTGVSRAQISLIENGKADPRMSTVVKLLSCYEAGLADLEPYPPEALSVDDLRARAERGARRLEQMGLGPSDPLARLDRKAEMDADVDAERKVLTTRA